MTESDSGSDDANGQVTTPVENPTNPDDGNTTPTNPETPKTTYTITFDANSGSASIENISAEEGSQITLPENAFTKDNYSFIGWGTSADGDVSYSNKAKITVTSNITLYAKWGLLAANAASVIAELAEGEHTVIVVGDISETLDDIASAIKSNAEAKVNLDLSQTTGITSIGYATFQDCNSLISVSIPSSVTSIDMNAFYKCTNLTSVIIPDGVTFIGVGAFSYCTSLTSINIPNSVIYFLYNVFMNCDSLKFNEFDNAKYLGNESNPYLVLIEAKDKNITSCNISTATKVIAGYAFEDCSSLESVVISDSVTSINGFAFYGCSSLTSVNIPDSVTSFEGGVFKYCTKLTFNEFDNAKYLGNESNPHLVLIEAKDENITSCNINTATKIIAGYAFRSCSNLTSVNIPASVTFIADSAFQYCDSLTTVNYRGTEEQWNTITIEPRNELLTGATINYSYTGE